jgi:(S)-2-hydroxyglutarate dehydrogenase
VRTAPPADVVVIGGGIVGMATAMALLRERPGLTLTVLEKERTLAAHQTGRNSGVIHSGIYYRPGSAKAMLCRAGVGRLLRFCEEESIPVLRCGKVIVATGPDELPALDGLLERGTANGVPGLRRVEPDELREIEPAAGGIAALHSPTTSSVDYRAVTAAMAGRVRDSGGVVVVGAGVRSLRRDGGRTIVASVDGELRARVVVNGAGLHADRVAAMDGVLPPLRIVPFRGEYRVVRPARVDLVRGMVYPVPDPALPFLGVHVTRGVDGGLHAGPNAVLALSREGYRWRDVSARDAWDTVRFPGFLRMGRRFWRVGLGEMARSVSRAGFARAVERLVPGIAEADLLPAPAGVRAQAVARDGRLIEDFWMARTPSAVHVLNVPSPAATASIAIGEHIARSVALALAD